MIRQPVTINPVPEAREHETDPCVLEQSAVRTVTAYVVGNKEFEGDHPDVLVVRVGVEFTEPSASDGYFELEIEPGELELGRKPVEKAVFVLDKLESFEVPDVIQSHLIQFADEFQRHRTNIPVAEVSNQVENTITNN